MTRIFFATDVHGSEVCWRKFINAGKFYGADVLVLGGDMTGKAVIPIVQGADGKYRVNYLEQQFTLKESEVDGMKRTIRDRGYYPLVITDKEYGDMSRDTSLVEQAFHRLVLQVAEEWLDFAESRLAQAGIDCYICPGNDDVFDIDQVFAKGTRVKLAEGRLCQIGKWNMISTGWANFTPWNTYRECSESELEAKLEELVGLVSGKMDRTIFNFHAPPFDSGIDEAPELDENLRPRYAGRSLVPVGSTAVRRIVEKCQPPLGLFGHIHEGKGIKRMGKTICINPGSMYEQGILLGVLIDLDDRGVKQYVMTSG